ncbi:pyrroloquinoline quinone biosynthesis protein PqqF [Pseudomonas benzenivorans]|uniref:Coenzyme PQQ synthesis protein F n=1 Tax=Pseudomonas benzenivorans TaxID=556533 RepID=A0ABZ0Q060_9PSED|nr:pyrroloquinoline quinone biosynthesis protein PqqF [Pseudomonas benzenivorans]WPC06535.1 pyrroloquinoline quinone biosynthesis protein PqqF [Pseudomonas benzenivorans]
MPEMPAPRPVRRRLANGLEVLLLSRAEAPRAAISLRVAAGSHDEPAAYPGLAHFLEHLVFLGSAGFAPEQGLMAYVQACGGQVNASTQARHTDYFCEVPADRLDGALARMLDMLARPLLEPAAQRREREVLHAEFLARGQDADTLLDAALGQALPAGHRAAAFLAGNRATLTLDSDAFQQALRAFHRRFYQAGQLSLVLVGPQSCAELLALVQCHADDLPAAARQVQAPPPTLLPLREQHLRMSLRGSRPSLQLAFALELPSRVPIAAFNEALALLQSGLSTRSAGSLCARLEEAALCRGLEVRLVYRHLGQALLLLNFAHVDPVGPAQASIAAALQDWLAFLASAADWGALAATRGALEARQLQALGPLALARHWQECLSVGREPGASASAEGLQAARTLLLQMRNPERAISLCVGPAEAPAWPGAGFPLHMSRTAPVAAVPPRAWNWRLPAANPLLGPVAAAPVVLGMTAALDWFAAPRGAGRAAFHGLLRFAEPPPLAQLLAYGQARLRTVQVDAQEVGAMLRLAVEGDGLQLSLEGPADLLPRLLAQVLARLGTAPAAAWPAPGAADATQMPLRQLLGRLPELFAAPGPEPARAGCTDWPGLFRRAHLEGLGVGLAAGERQAIARLFARTACLPPTEPLARPAPGRYWRDAAIDAPEAALLLFCPQPAADAASEAGWRLLAQLYQGPFFARLRGELQLGYALFCGFRQVEGRRGILFAVQSPKASTTQLLGHIEAFLAAQGERLAWLAEQELRVACGELARQLGEQAASVPGRAELRWQQHLAGLPQAHGEAVRQALNGFESDELQRCHRALCQARGGWRVLAGGAPPA